MAPRSSRSAPPALRSIRFFINGSLCPIRASPGSEALFFASGGRDLITSPLESVERPAKELVQDYPAKIVRWT